MACIERTGICFFRRCIDLISLHVCKADTILFKNNKYGYYHRQGITSKCENVSKVLQLNLYVLDDAIELVRLLGNAHFLSKNSESKKHQRLEDTDDEGSLIEVSHDFHFDDPNVS